MDNTTKLGLSIVGLFVFFIGLSAGVTLEASRDHLDLKVGDCVRELGHDTIETVSAVTNKGAVETRYFSKSANIDRIGSYYSFQAEKLLKVECKK